LLHYLEKLRFESFLVSETRFNVEVFFGDVLTADLLLNDSLARVANLFEGRCKLRGGDARDYGDALVWLCACRNRVLFELRRDYESAVRFGSRGDLAKPLGWRFGFKREFTVANDLAVNRFRRGVDRADGGK
jgi:hypothetical protein